MQIQDKSHRKVPSAKLVSFTPTKVAPTFCRMLAECGDLSFGKAENDAIRYLPSHALEDASTFRNTKRRSVIINGVPIGNLIVCINPGIVAYVGELPEKLLGRKKKKSVRRERVDSDGKVWVHVHLTFVSKEGEYLVRDRGAGRFDSWPINFP